MIKCKERTKKPVICFDSNDNFVAWYESIKQASIDTGISSSNINVVCKGNKKCKLKNLKFKYANGDII